MEWSKEVTEYVNKIMESEFEALDFDEEIEGGNELFAIRPAVAFTVSGAPYPVYGIFNRETGMREADTGQLKTAKDYAAALKAQNLGQDLPGLGGVQAKPVQKPPRGN